MVQYEKIYYIYMAELYEKPWFSMDLYLVVLSILKNKKVNGKHYPYIMEKYSKCSKAPTSICVYGWIITVQSFEASWNKTSFRIVNNYTHYTHHHSSNAGVRLWGHYNSSRLSMQNRIIYDCMKHHVGNIMDI